MKAMLTTLFVSLIICFAGTEFSAAAPEHPRTFDAERLKTVHDRLLAEYAVERANPNMIPGLVYPRLTSALEQAGVRQLLDGTPDRVLPPATHLAILNDYGFWLSRTADPRKALPVLQRVVELAPVRAIAQLNLGDAARSALTLAETWEQKIRLSKIALQAYSAYQRLAGKEAPAAREFSELHSGRPPSEDVCSYVAAFYHRGRQKELWGYPDPVDVAGDGKLRHVYLFDEGTAHVPVIFASTKAIPVDDRVVESFGGGEVDFKGTGDEENGYLNELHVLPFREGYYLVVQADGGPSSVIKPNKGTVCRFKRSFAPALVEDHAPAICKQAVSGKAFDRIPDQPLPDQDRPTDAASLDLPGDGTQFFNRYSDLQLDPAAARVRVGYYELASGAGPGCDIHGVALLDGPALEKSPSAKALIEAHARSMDCRGSTAFLVQANGESLIEIDGGRAVQRTVPPRTLLRLRGDNVETVCRVEQQPTYTPERVTHAP